MKYLSNLLLDQILNLVLDENTKFYKSFKLRWSQMEDDLKILKVEYLCNHLLDHTQILNPSLDDQTQILQILKI